MSKPDTLPRVRAIFKDQFNLDHDDANRIIETRGMKELYEECWADSLDKIELQIAVEEEFSISIPDESCESFNTVGDLVNFIDKERG